MIGITKTIRFPRRPVHTIYTHHRCVKVRAAGMENIGDTFHIHQFRHSHHYAMLITTLLLLLSIATTTLVESKDTITVIELVITMATSFSGYKPIVLRLHFHRCLIVRSSSSSSIMYQIQLSECTSHGTTLV